VSDRPLVFRAGDAVPIERGAGVRTVPLVGGRDVTRTICVTGETVEHLSDQDRRTTG